MTAVSNINTPVFDDDGTALVIHKAANDYHPLPSGAAGPRIARGVIEPRSGD